MNNTNQIIKKRKFIKLILILLTIGGIVAPIVIFLLKKQKCAKEGESCEGNSKGCCPDAPLCNNQTKICMKPVDVRYTQAPQGFKCTPLDILSTSGDKDQLIKQSQDSCDADDSCTGFQISGDVSYMCKGFFFKDSTPDPTDTDEYWANDKAEYPSLNSRLYTDLSISLSNCKNGENELYPNLRTSSSKTPNLKLCGSTAPQFIGGNDVEFYSNIYIIPNGSTCSTLGENWEPSTYLGKKSWGPVCLKRQNLFNSDGTLTDKPIYGELSIEQSTDKSGIHDDADDDTCEKKGLVNLTQSAQTGGVVKGGINKGSTDGPNNLYLCGKEIEIITKKVI